MHASKARAPGVHFAPAGEEQCVPRPSRHLHSTHRQVGHTSESCHSWTPETDVSTTQSRWSDFKRQTSKCAEHAPRKAEQSLNARLADIQVRGVRHNCWRPGACSHRCTRSRRWRRSGGLAAGARVRAPLPGAPDHAVARAVLRHRYAHRTCNASLRGARRASALAHGATGPGTRCVEPWSTGAC